MIKLASIALTSVLGVAGIASTVPAVASPAVVVDVPVPVFVGGPYAYRHGPFGPAYAGYWHRDFGRDYYRHGWNWDHYRDHRGYRR
jgi:hypothetical protein